MNPLPIDLPEKTFSLGTQKVIGISRSTSKRSKTKTVNKSMSIGIQAWELAAFLAAISLYEYVSGPGSFSQNLMTPWKLNTNSLPGNPGSNPGSDLFYSAIYGAASSLQGGINYLEGVKL